MLLKGVSVGFPRTVHLRVCDVARVPYVRVSLLGPDARNRLTPLTPLGDGDTHSPAIACCEVGERAIVSEVHGHGAVFRIGHGFPSGERTCPGFHMGRLVTRHYGDRGEERD